MAKFTIVIPCFNQMATIAEAINSSLVQNYSDYDIAVTDNASTDGSSMVIDGFDHPKLKKYLCADFVSKTDNWNRAYGVASDCEYLVTLHADDILSPDALAHIDNATRDRPALIHGRFRSMRFDGTPIEEIRFPFSYSTSGREFQRLLLLGNIVSVPGTAVRRDVFEAVGKWDRDWTFLQDVELWYQAANHGRVAYIGKPLASRRGVEDPKINWNYPIEHLQWIVKRVSDAPDSGTKKAALRNLGILDLLVRSELERTTEPPPDQLHQALQQTNAVLKSQGKLLMDPRKLQRGLRLLYSLRSLIYPHTL
jgi:glycosyltransferase involved in cell wall biosynthesis